MTTDGPLRIGITGGIGSGKSLVCRLFALLDVPIYEADTRARRLMTDDEALRAEIKRAFGAEAYDAAGDLNRAYLAERVFNDPVRLEALNRLVHPRVGTDWEAWVGAHHAAPYVLKEAALLYESGSYQTLDRIIVVRADEATRLARTLRRDPHRDATQVRAIMSKQLPDAAKVRRADHLVHNDGGQLVIPQVLALDASLRAAATKSAG
ncbi:MAG: dephospho-CoA kinase [Catalinimonas sp.]